jgi:hypothetical protein
VKTKLTGFSKWKAMVSSATSSRLLSFARKFGSSAAAVLMLLLSLFAASKLLLFGLGL